MFSRKKIRRRRFVLRRKGVTLEELERQRRERDRFFFGSAGAASPVKKIDPKTGKVVAVIPAHQ